MLPDSIEELYEDFQDHVDVFDLIVYYFGDITLLNEKYQSIHNKYKKSIIEDAGILSKYVKDPKFRTLLDKLDLSKYLLYRDDLNLEFLMSCNGVNVVATLYEVIKDTELYQEYIKQNN